MNFSSNCENVDEKTNIFRQSPEGVFRGKLSSILEDKSQVLKRNESEAIK